MGQTVIGVFADKDDANRAVSALKQAGYNDADIDFSSRSDVLDDNTRRTQRREKTGGFFENLFGGDDNYDETTRNNYREAATRGTVVTVHTKDMGKAEQAADILDRFGAIDANDAATKLRGKGVAADDYEHGLRDHKADFTYDDNYTTDADSVKVMKEDIAVGKREVATGGVRLRSRIVSKPVTEEVRLREERVVLNRTPVDRPATEADFDSFKEGTVEMTEKAEVAVVQKNARVVEEVSLGKQASEHTEQISETVRETEVEVEEFQGEAVTDATQHLDRDGDGRVG